MTSPSVSPPSEGEIIESDSEKATTAISGKGASVDRAFRTRVSISRSPSPVRSRSPRRQKSRTTSRSPYRENRGAKRSLNDDHYDRTRNDPRRFKVRYEDHPSSRESKLRNDYDSIDQSASSEKDSRHKDQAGNGRVRDRRPQMTSRSSFQPKPQRSTHDNYRGTNHHSRGAREDWREQGERGYDESRSRLSTEQSVSDRGHSPVAAARLRREAEFRNNQTEREASLAEQRRNSTTEYVR